MPEQFQGLGRRDVADPNRNAHVLHVSQEPSGDKTAHVQCPFCGRGQFAGKPGETQCLCGQTFNVPG